MAGDTQSLGFLFLRGGDCSTGPGCDEHSFVVLPFRLALRRWRGFPGGQGRPDGGFEIHSSQSDVLRIIRERFGLFPARSMAHYLTLQHSRPITVR